VADSNALEDTTSLVIVDVKMLVLVERKPWVQTMLLASQKKFTGWLPEAFVKVNVSHAAPLGVQRFVGG
jgi:hypothetical protein